VVVGAISTVVLWPKPPEAPVLVLLSAPNATNIAVPQDATGHRGADALAAALPAARVIRRTLVTNNELMGRDVWGPLEGLKKDRKLVMFVAAHGGVDANGMFLLPEGADPADADSIVRVNDLLDHLKKVPCAKKLLVLDATRVPVYWPLGQLNNEFGNAVAGDEFKKQVAAVPGLVVLAASGPDQQSWVSDGRQMSAFAYAVAEGARGAADLAPSGNENRRVTAAELHKYAVLKVGEWIRANRNAAQVPQLIDPRNMAGDIELNAIDPNQPPAAAEELVTFAPTPELTAMWQAADHLRSSHPAVNAPQLWRRYLETGLRVEQLLRAGDADDAARARRDFEALGQQVRDARKLPVGSLSCSLALPAALGDSLPAQDVALMRQALDRVWDQKDVKDDDFARLAEDGVVKGNVRGLLSRQSALTDLLLQRATDRPDANLARAAARLPRFDGPRPAEAQPLPYLAAHRPADCPAALVTLALSVRRQGERAALGLGDDGGLPACSEQVYPWIRGTLKTADEQRRVGEDLLVSRKSDYAEAERLLRGAEADYRKAQRDAEKVRHALVVRADSLAELPYYSMWVVKRVPAAGASDMTALETLWGQVHELDAALGRAEPAGPDDLARLADRVDGGLKDLRSQFDEKAALLALQAPSLQESYHQIDTLLRVPFVPAKRREALLLNAGTIAHDLEGSNQSAGIDEKVAAEAVHARTERSGRAAVALLGRDWINADAGHPVPAGDDVARGDAVAYHWRRLLTEANRLTEQARVADAVDGRQGSLASLGQASAVARHLDGGAAGRLAGDPADDYRRLLASELLSGLAWRAAFDDWGGDADVPYYRRVARDYLDAAESLALPPARRRNLGEKQRTARRDRVETARAQIEAIKEPALEWADREQPRGAEGAAATEYHRDGSRLELTVDDRIERNHRVTVPSEVGAAAPVVFNHIGPRLETVKDDEQPFALRIRPGEKVLPSRNFTLALAIPEGPPPALVRTDYTATALYRGRVLSLRTDVGAHFIPETVAWRPEADQVRVAVQAPPKLYEQFGQGDGRVAIVLDCSESMNTRLTAKTADGKTREVTRFELAVEGLTQVLKELPAGTQVSLWAFGQNKQGVRLPDEVEKTIEQIMPPQTWGDPAKPKQLDELMARVRNLQPYSWSPILRAMLAAKADLRPEAGGGYRTLLVLTDGVDNRFEGRADKEFNPDGKKTVAVVLREQFQNTGIALKMVGFQLSERERPVAMTQFAEPIRKLTYPDGEFLPDAQKLDDLIANLRIVLPRRLVYQVLGGPNGRREFATGQTITRIGNNPAWVTLPLPGEYTIRVNATRPVTQQVQVRLGESLLLKLAERDTADEGETNLVLERVLHARTTDPLTLPQPSKFGPWLLGTWEDQRNDRGTLEVMTTLESTERVRVRPTIPLEQQRPNLVWFRVNRGDDPAPAHGLRFYPLYSAAAPAWQLEVRDWSARSAPSVTTWWDGQEVRVRGWTLVKAPEGDQAEPGQWRALVARDAPEDADARAVSERARWRWEQKRVVQTAPGQKPEERACLVVSLTYPRDKPFFVRLPDDLSTVGEEHSIYPGANRYIGVFWTRDPRLLQKLQQVQSLSVVSLEEFKSAAERARQSGVVALPPPQ
jgi:hypothetical protein